MRVIVMSSIFPSSAEINKGIYIYRLVKELSTLCQVKVIAPIPYVPPLVKSERYDMYSRIGSREVIGGLDVLHPRVLLTPKIGHSLYGLSYAYTLVRSLRRLSESFVPDIVLNYWVYPDGFASVIAARAFKLPIVVGGRGCDVNDPKSIGIKKMVSWTLKKSDKVLAVSTDMKRKMQELGAPPDKIRVVPNGVSGEFAPKDQDASRRAMNLSERAGGKKLILYCGRFSPEKGTEYLLRAAALLKEKGLPFHLLLVGSGEGEKSIRCLIEDLALRDYVEVRGEVSHDDIPTLMNCADVLCLPSIREGWPNVVVEALACGVPVVASEVGGVPEILTDPSHGIMVPKADVPALANGLIAAVQKDWTRQTIGKTIRERTWAKAAGEVYEEMETALAL